MKTKMILTACLAACVSLSASAYSLFDYANTSNSVIQFAGDGTFSIAPAINNIQISDGTAAGLLGEVTGTFTIGAITTVGTVSSAPVTGTGTLVIHDGSTDLTATLVWYDITQVGNFDGLDTSGTINLTGVTYLGSNPDLVALKAAGSADNAFTFQFIPAVSLLNLTSGKFATSFSGTIIYTPPVCNCTVAFNSPASITYCSDQTISNVVATEDCGAGPVLVTPDIIGTATSGVCPQIITITNSVTDTCGNAHLFVQTVTVNCTPDCTVTPSVAITIVGTTGLTASVTDAGPGATYIWSVMNGVITATNGNTITWTAGTDTSSPVAITVTVTTAAGCSSTCSAPVYLTSKPPPTSLGTGDSATIGFWHNKNGQGLILGAPTSPSLANWLASTFPCMYGSLAGKANSDVATLFLNDFGVKGQKTYAQILGGALDCYFTSSNLGGGTASSKFGFNITPGGTGSKLFNVGLLGTTIGLKNNTSYTVLQILQAANANINCSKGTFSTAVFNALNTIFDGINSTGDITS